MARTVAELEVVATGNTSDAEGKLEALSGKVNQSSADVKKASMAFIGAGLAMAGGLGMAVGTASRFEAAITGIGAVSGLTQSQLDQVRQVALKLGSDTAFSATEAATAMDTLLKAGMPLPDVLNGGAKAALDLAAAAGTDVTTAATLMTSAISVFGDEAGSTTDVVNSFNAAANASAADINSLALGFSMAALPAKMMGLSLDDLNTALALFSQSGLEGSDAGTSFKTMLIAMASPTKEQKALMDQLGISFFDAQGKFTGLEGAAEELRAGLSGMSEEQRMATLAVLFGNDAVRAASILFKEGASGIQAMRGEMAGQQAAAEQAAYRMQGFAGAMETLKGSLETAAIIIGGTLTPALTDVAGAVQGVVSWFNSLNPQTQEAIGKGLALASGLMVLAGALGMTSTVLGPVAAGFSMLVSPIGLVAAAIAGLYLAYQTNFLGFADGVNAGIALLKENWPALQGAIETAVAAISGAWQSLATAFQTHKATIDAVLNGLSTVFSAVWPVLAQTVSDQIEGIKTALTGLGTALSGLYTTVSGAVALIKAVLTGDFGAAKDAVIQIVEGLRTTVEGIILVLKGTIQVQTAAIKNLAVAAFNLLKEGAIAAFTGLKDKAIELVTGLKTGIVNTINELLGTAVTLVTGLKTVAVAQFNELKTSAVNTVTGLKDEIVGKLNELLGSAGALAMQIGTAIGQGIIDGIAGMKDAVMQMAGQIVDDAIGWMKGKLHIGSPSRVTMELGRWTAEGLAEGMRGQLSAVLRSAGQLAAATTQPLAPVPSMVTAAAVQPVRSGPATVVYQTFHVTVSVDALEDLTRAAEFVRTLPRERELVFGGAF